ncbi:MAG: hypothetical protein U5L96_01890 [Owenweeksia sp.]|nr:hypothetical protein [Owenweeksia sp.]
MKKILLSISVLLSMLLLFSCNKENQDPDYPFTVVVKTLEDSIRVNNIYVEVEAPVRGSIPHFEGYTNEKGEVSFTYDQNAILLIRATREIQKIPLTLAVMRCG